MSREEGSARSLETESHDHLRQWLERSSDDTQKGPFRRHGLAGRLFEATFQLLTSIQAAAQPSIHITPKNKQQCKNEIERLFLWGDGFGACDGSLDDILDKSAELKINVLSLLSELAKLATQNLFKVVQPPELKVHEELSDVKMLLETTQAVLDEECHQRRNSLAFSDSEYSEGDFAEGVDDISTFTDCLMDLAPALENPALDIEFKEESNSTMETFQVSSTMAANYCRKIRDRFPNLDIKMVQKLGEANQVRSQRIQEALIQSESAAMKGGEVPQDVSEPLFSRSGGKHTETTKSTFVSGSIFSTDRNATGGVSKEDYDDVASQTTFATFSTVFSKAAQGIPRVPPLPESARAGRPFRCVACGRLLRNIRNRRVWKKHIFNDLRPYVCTSTTLEANRCIESFPSRSAWIQHEATHLEARLQEIMCGFCPPKKAARNVNAHFKHLGRHLREIALAVLRQSESDSDSEVGSTSSKKSMSEISSLRGSEMESKTHEYESGAEAQSSIVGSGPLKNNHKAGFTGSDDGTDSGSGVNRWTPDRKARQNQRETLTHLSQPPDRTSSLSPVTTGLDEKSLQQTVEDKTSAIVENDSSDALLKDTSSVHDEYVPYVETKRAERRQRRRETEKRNLSQTVGGSDTDEEYVTPAFDTDNVESSARRARKKSSDRRMSINSESLPPRVVELEEEPPEKREEYKDKTEGISQINSDTRELFSREEVIPGADEALGYLANKADPFPLAAPKTDDNESKSLKVEKCLYKTGKTLGAGFHSVVKECVHIDTGRYYAAKVINKRLMMGREAMVRNEIAALKRVSMGHKNILTLVDYFETLNNLYLVVDLALGGELFDRICRKGSYYEVDAAGIIRNVLSGTAYLHDHGIVHGNLTAENILFRTTEDNTDIIIAGFTLSKIVQGNLLEDTGLHMGEDRWPTPGHHAPEVMKNTGHGKPVDMWSIGILTYFLLCGYTPFDRDSDQEERMAILAADYSFTPFEYWRGVSSYAKDFIKQCFVIEPKLRMTAHEGLSHPFIALKDNKEMGMKDSLGKTSFNPHRTFRAGVLLVIALQRFCKASKHTFRHKSQELVEPA